MTSIGAAGSGGTIDRLLRPTSAVVIGASERQESLGWKVANALDASSIGDRLSLVHPNGSKLLGRTVYPSVSSLDSRPDVAIVVVPAGSVPEVIGECSAAGIPNAIVISGGFAESGDGADLQQAMMVKAIAADGHRTRLLGPNAEGIVNVVDDISMSFTGILRPELLPVGLRKGNIAVVAQSGGVGYGVFSQALQLGLGFSYVISTGNEADLSVNDFLAWLIDDDSTDVIICFLEGIKDGMRFLDIADEALAAGKAIIIGKAGESEPGSRAAVSHTGHLIGSADAYRAAYQRTGAIEARDQQELIDIAAGLASNPRAHGSRVGIVTVSGGAGAWLADQCAARGLDVPVLSPGVQTSIGAALTPFATSVNPIDAAGQHQKGVLDALDRLVSSGEIDVVMLVVSLGGSFAADSLVEAVVRTRREAAVPILVMSTTAVPKASLQLLANARVHVYSSGDQIARAAKALVEHGRNVSERATETESELAPDDAPSAEADLAGVHISLEGRLDEGRNPASPSHVLCEYEAKTILSEHGVPIPDGVLARSVDEVHGAAERLGFPLVLKVQSPELPHKTESGGVRMGIADEAALEEATTVLFEMRPAVPDFRGVLVERMATPVAEVIVGSVFDDDFGPLTMLGMGGIWAEVFNDRAIRLAPVSEDDAKGMIRELKGRALLEGVRGQPAADIDALVRLVVAVSAFTVAAGERIKELEVNPAAVMRVGEGASALDALIVAR